MKKLSETIEKLSRKQLEALKGGTDGINIPSYTLSLDVLPESKN